MVNKTSLVLQLHLHSCQYDETVIKQVIISITTIKTRKAQAAIRSYIAKKSYLVLGYDGDFKGEN